MTSPGVLVIVGPTAVGKSAVALAVAQRLGGEIISADSMQVYRGLDIGTAKPSAAEQRAVPHHLIDLRDPDGEFSVADFQRAADAAIADIAARGRRPILVGGTGFYMRAVLREYGFADLRKEPGLRERLQAEVEHLGPVALHRRLAAVDPASARRIHPNDARRIVRALEVYELVGIPRSELQAGGPGPPRYPYRMFGLTLPRPVLYERIDARVEAMLAAGWLDEVRRLLGAGYSPALPALQGLGYRELVQYLRGFTPWAGCVEWIKRNTRRYAKRQYTWFRREEGIEWVDVSTGLPATMEVIVKLAAGK